MPGVLDTLTHENVGGQADTLQQARGGDTTTTMENDHVWHDGQIIGIVVADAYEAAREAAFRLHVRYEAQPPAATFGSLGAEEEVCKAGGHEDYQVGDAEGASAPAPVRLDAQYGTPTQHHNPIEPFTTTCAWTGKRLTIWEPSQFVCGLRGTVAKQPAGSACRTGHRSRSGTPSSGSATARAEPTPKACLQALPTAPCRSCTAARTRSCAGISGRTPRLMPYLITHKLQPISAAGRA